MDKERKGRAFFIKQEFKRTVGDFNPQTNSHRERQRYNGDIQRQIDRQIEIERQIDREGELNIWIRKGKVEHSSLNKNSKGRWGISIHRQIVTEKERVIMEIDRDRQID